MWRNTEDSYGLMAITLHWLVALGVVGLFGLGLWMVELNYYHPWYHTAPWVHKSLGVLLFGLLVVRLVWRGLDPPPRPEPTLTHLERVVSRFVHAVLYLLLVGVILSGYLIATAEGQAVSVFGLFEVPATLTRLPRQADWAGELHLALAIVLVLLVVFHAGAALKHHFIDRDRTLRRMLRSKPRSG